MPVALYNTQAQHYLSTTPDSGAVHESGHSVSTVNAPGCVCWSTLMKMQGS